MPTLYLKPVLPFSWGYGILNDMVVISLREGECNVDNFRNLD